MKYRRLVILLIATTVAAQEPIITPDTPVNPATLIEWVHSGDPRLIAWAADFAQRRHDTAVITQLSLWLEHASIPPTYGGDEREQAQRRAVLAALDAFIQENAQVPIPVIASVSRSFVAQAAILISRYPLRQSLDELYEWFSVGNVPKVRLAAMMFARNPRIVLISSQLNLTFVGGMVADSESEVHITLVPGDYGRAGGFGGAACGDGGGYRLPAGWPQVYTYNLVENDPGADGPEVIALGGDRIASRRHKENGGWGSCHAVQPLNAETRHRLIAYWLGVKPEEMPWQPQQYFTIKWTNESEYHRQVGKIVEDQRQKLHATSDALRARGILEGPDAIPKLEVVIHCEVQPCPLN